MSTEKTDAIVIRMVDFSESSHVVTLFSREHGKISAIAKGAKRPKSAFEAALDLLCVCRIVFIRKSSAGLDILTEAQLVKRFKPPDRHLGSLYGGYYVAELLAGLTEEYDVHTELYEEAVLTLDRLAGEDDLRLIVLRFELVLLREIGQLPTLDFCVACGEPLGAQPWYGLRVIQGGLVCRNCVSEDSGARRLHAGTVAVLKRLSSKSDQGWQRVSASPAQFREMRTVVDPAIRNLLGRRPKTLRYLQFK